MEYTQYLIAAVDAAVKSGGEILGIYQSDFAVEMKEDNSPLTLADKRSHAIIKAGLVDFGIPIISEEGKNIPYKIRRRWSKVWIVDPLDGTKEFIKRNGEFTVNIALIEDGRPVMGVVYAPVPEWLYFSSTEVGAFKLKNINPDTFESNKAMADEDRLQTWLKKASRLPMDQSRMIYTIVGSRSHCTPELEAFVEAKRQEKGNIEFVAAGSSLKICLVAEGAADIYPRLGPTMEWDTAAGQAIAQYASARVYVHGSGEDLKYNRKEMLNPWFVVERQVKPLSFRAG